MTSKGKIAKTYQTPYGDVRVERHVYQGGLGGRGGIVRWKKMPELSPLRHLNLQR